MAAPGDTVIGKVSREVIEFAVRKYVEATGRQPNVLLEQREDLDRKAWILTIELSDEALIQRMENHDRKRTRGVL